MSVEKRLRSATFELTSEPLDLETVAAAVRRDADGAIVTFLGVVRDHARGRSVTHLHYEAYAAMAEHQMERIFEQLASRDSSLGVRVVHRTGTIAIGEASIAIAVASAHRVEAFDACRFLIDRIKETVPIWKKEFYEGGEVWVSERS
ncbi:MAG: molybdenum cofactor biosynthesis protein MoaE [Planctomycetes bacterium]|nr:molybdenum cofactor biosynthesis protein MoaE [Planctomycetota bacterium]